MPLHDHQTVPHDEMEELIKAKLPEDQHVRALAVMAEMLPMHSGHLCSLICDIDDYAEYDVMRVEYEVGSIIIDSREYKLPESVA